LLGATLTNHIRIPQHVYAKAAYLLPMLYKASEISSELDIPLSTLKGWLKQGIPHQRDGRNHIFVSGEEFSKWINSIQKNKRIKPTLKDNQAYCLKCRKPIDIKNPELVNVAGTRLIQGTCPICQTKVNKGIEYDQ
jgi:uncharacterized protein with PIN domain